MGQMTIPRELGIRDGRLIQNPVRELEKIRGAKVSYENILLNGAANLDGVIGRVLDLTVTVKKDTEDYGCFYMKFAKDSRFYSELTYHPGTGVLRISREHSGTNRDVVHHRECKVRNRQGEIKLRLILDKFSAEIFVNDGEQALSMTMFTAQTAEEITFESDKPVRLSVEKYSLNR